MGKKAKKFERIIENRRAFNVVGTIKYSGMFPHTVQTPMLEGLKKSLNSQLEDFLKDKAHPRNCVRTRRG